MASHVGSWHLRQAQHQVEPPARRGSSLLPSESSSCAEAGASHAGPRHHFTTRSFSF